jgi:hypothetical protein
MRTPKVRNRTVPAFVYVVLPYLLVGYSAYTFKVAWEHDLWSNAIFAAVNAVLGGYAIVAFIGIRHSLIDIWANVVSWLYKPQKFKPTPARSGAATTTPAASDDIGDWAFVLYMGFADRRRSARHITDLSEPDRTSLTLPVSAPAVADRDAMPTLAPKGPAAETSVL